MAGSHTSKPALIDGVSRGRGELLPAEMRNRPTPHEGPPQVVMPASV